VSAFARGGNGGFSNSEDFLGGSGGAATLSSGGLGPAVFGSSSTGGTVSCQVQQSVATAATAASTAVQADLLASSAMAAQTTRLAARQPAH
jgi:hypothetical protein